MKKSVIYCIENIVNGKKYVGQTVDYRSRKRRHLWKLRKGNHFNNYLQRSYNKYGEENFKIYILEEVAKEELNDREIYWIDKLNSFDGGYNLTSGGDGGFEVSEEVRRNISEANKGRIISEDHRMKLSEAAKGKNNPMYGKKGENSPMYGKNHNEETKRKISEANKGKARSEEARRKISEANYKLPKEQYLEIYKLYHNTDLTQKEVGDKFNVSRRTVGNIANHKHGATKHLAEDKQLQMSL